ncbi:MAG: hypothetical protein K1060chlam4_00351 [Candidatus Anoxychlamydiales bacterium]|nr:hypothetical protein [Candidatus Anoxychlamydiales bacterium]
MNKKILINLFLYSFLINSCMRVDTNPDLDFQKIKKDIAESTSHSPYWDKSLNNTIAESSSEKLFKKELDVNLAVQIALLNNAHLQAIYENLGIAKAKYAQAGLLKNPIFSLIYRFSTKTKISDLIDIDLMQNFLEMLLIPLKKKVSGNELDATINMVKAEILDIIAQTKIVFYSLAAENQILKLKKTMLLAEELSYEVAQRLFKAGNIKELDLEIKRSSYEQLKLEVASQEIIILENKEKLNILMGLWGKNIDWSYLSTLPRIAQKEESLNNVENEAIAKSLELKIAYKNLLATASRLGLDTTKIIFPQFNAGISSERDEGIWYVGPSINFALPLFDIGKAYSSFANAKIASLWKEYTALAIDIRSQARSARFILLNAYRQSKYLSEIIVPLAEKVTYDSFLQLNAMQIGVFDLLQAKQKEIEKKIHSVKMIKEYWIAKTKIELLLQGHMIEQKVYKINSEILFNKDSL